MSTARNRTTVTGGKKTKKKAKASTAPSSDASTLIVPVQVPWSREGKIGPRDYHPKHLDLQLSTKQGAVMAGLVNGLRASNAELENGNPVITKVDATRWLLENLGAALPPRALA